MKFYLVGSIGAFLRWLVIAAIFGGLIIFAAGSQGYNFSLAANWLMDAILTFVIVYAVLAVTVGRTWANLAVIAMFLYYIVGNHITYV